MSYGHDDSLRPVDGELVDRGSFTEQQARGEVDMQVSTARRYPRSIKQFKERALNLATLDEETAGSCFYTLPARKGGDGKPIEGPSARLAEIVAGSWGNIRAQASVVSDDGEFITAQGRCWDLETNVAISVDVRRRITDKFGKRYSADMINTTANAACSIALRNSVFKVVPMAIVKPVYEQARKVAIGDAQTLVSRRAKMVDEFKKMGVPPERVYAVVEKASIEDITLDDIGTLRGLYTAIKEGDATIDEVFPAPAKPSNGTEQKPASKSDELADKLKAQKTEAASPEPVSAPTGDLFPNADTKPAAQTPAELLAPHRERLATCVTSSNLIDCYDAAKAALTPELMQVFEVEYDAARKALKNRK